MSDFTVVDNKVYARLVHNELFLYSLLGGMIHTRDMNFDDLQPDHKIGVLAVQSMGIVGVRECRDHRRCYLEGGR